jgi:hypothetical protein
MPESKSEDVVVLSGSVVNVVTLAGKQREPGRVNSEARTHFKLAERLTKGNGERAITLLIHNLTW